MFPCAGPRAGTPRAASFSRCQTSSNQPRSSRRTSRRSTSSPATGVVASDTATLLQALHCVRRLGVGLVRAPPVFMRPIPSHGVGQTPVEIAEPRQPPQLRAQLARLDGVPLVVAGPVGDQLVVVLR